MQIKIQYYALLREQAGRSDESLDTARRDAARRCTRNCARAIRSRSRRDQLKVAVNGEFCDWTPRAARRAMRSCSFRRSREADCASASATRRIDTAAARAPSCWTGVRRLRQLRGLGPRP